MMFFNNKNVFLNHYVFTYIYCLLIEKDICVCQNILVKLLCVYVRLSSGDLFIFSARISSSFSLFLCYLYFGTLFFHAV
jgi:hypothetical protein